MIPGYIGARARSVAEIIEKLGNYQGQVVSVHGVLYRGPEYPDFVLLPKIGWFDGAGVMAADTVQRRHVVGVADPRLSETIQQNISPAFGAMQYKMDCIAFGTVSANGEYGAALTDLIAVTLMNMRLPEGPRPEVVTPNVHVLLFPGDHIPKLPWRNPPGNVGFPIVQLGL